MQIDLPTGRPWRRRLVEAAIDAVVVGTLIVVAILADSAFVRWASLAAAWLLLFGKFLVWQGRRR